MNYEDSDLRQVNDEIESLLRSDVDARKDAVEVARREGYQFTRAKLKAFHRDGYRGIRLPALEGPDGSLRTTRDVFLAWLTKISTRPGKLPDYRLVANGALWNSPAHAIPVRTTGALPSDFRLSFSQGGGIGQWFAIGFLPDHERGRLVAVYHYRTAAPSCVPVPLGCLLPLFRNASGSQESWWRWTGERLRHYRSRLTWDEGELSVECAAFRQKKVEAPTIGNDTVDVGDPENIKLALSRLLFAGGIMVGVTGGANQNSTSSSLGKPCPVCGSIDDDVHDTKTACVWTEQKDIICCGWESDDSFARNYMGHYVHLRGDLQVRVVDR